jgi:hypothetical protein
MDKAVARLNPAGKINVEKIFMLASEVRNKMASIGSKIFGL